MLSSNRQPKLSQTSPKKRESPALPLSADKNPRKHRSIRTAKRKRRLSYAMPDRNKNRLAPLTKNRLNLENARRSAGKREGFAIKSLPLRRNIRPHLPPEDMQTPLDNSKKTPCKALSAVRRGKNTRITLAKRRKSLGIHRNLLGEPPQGGNTTRSFAHKNQAV